MDVLLTTMLPGNQGKEGCVWLLEKAHPNSQSSSIPGEASVPHFRGILPGAGVHGSDRSQVLYHRAWSGWA